MEDYSTFSLQITRANIFEGLFLEGSLGDRSYHTGAMLAEFAFVVLWSNQGLHVSELTLVSVCEIGQRENDCGMLLL